MACGTADPDDWQREERVLASALPTGANFDAWAPIWSEDSWIVALKHESPASKDENVLRSAIVKSMLADFDIGPTSRAYESLGTFLSRNISTEVIPIRGVTSLQENWKARGETLEFGYVQFRNAESLWRTLAERAGSAALVPWNWDNPRIDALRQWRALESTEGVAWAEPNLQSEILQSTGDGQNPSSGGSTGGGSQGNNGGGENAGGYPRPSEWEKSEFVRVLDRIRWPQTMDFAQREGLLPGRQIVVGVVDTGVDYLHPDLVNSMFKNPGEAKINPADPEKKAGVDDDGNGWIDDIHGINAAIPMGQVDTGDDPDPGPADLGGGGRNCPTPKDGSPDSTIRCGHGTHVAGIVAATHDNGNSTLGVCPLCRILSMRVSRRCLEPASKLKGKSACEPVINKAGADWERNGNIEDVAQVRALAYVLQLKTPDGARIYTNLVNLSLGKYFYSRSLRTLIKKLRESEVIVVAAAGNSNTETPMYPAAYNDVVAVCATSEDTSSNGRGVFAKAEFSNFGDWVDICAPGVNIHSLWPGPGDTPSSGGTTHDESGTSMAGPVVTGAFGLFRSLKPNIDSAQAVIDAFLQTANAEQLYKERNNLHYGDAFNGRPLWLMGHGLVDIECAVRGVCPRQNNVYAAMRRKSNQQIDQSGCIVSSVARSDSSTGWWHALGSLPFLLLQFAAIVRICGCFRKRI